MFKYRVIGSRTGGNGIKQYKILDLETGEVFENRAAFFFEKGNDAFINVSVRPRWNFSVLRRDKVA